MIKASWIQNTKLTQGMTQPGRPYIQLKEPHSFTKTIKFVAQKINHVPRSTLNGNHTGKCFIVALFVIHVASFMHPPPLLFISNPMGKVLGTTDCGTIFLRIGHRLVRGVLYTGKLWHKLRQRAAAN